MCAVGVHSFPWLGLVVGEPFLKPAPTSLAPTVLKDPAWSAASEKVWGFL